MQFNDFIFRKNLLCVAIVDLSSLNTDMKASRGALEFCFNVFIKILSEFS